MDVIKHSLLLVALLGWVNLTIGQEAMPPDPQRELEQSVTINGVTYENVRWGKVTPATITLFHRTGVATLPLDKLPPELQKRFNYDPIKAATYKEKLDRAVRTDSVEATRATTEKSELRQPTEAAVDDPSHIPTDRPHTALNSKFPMERPATDYEASRRAEDAERRAREAQRAADAAVSAQRRAYQTQQTALRAEIKALNAETDAIRKEIRGMGSIDSTRYGNQVLQAGDKRRELEGIARAKEQVIRAKEAQLQAIETANRSLTTQGTR